MLSIYAIAFSRGAAFFIYVHVVRRALLNDAVGCMELYIHFPKFVLGVIL